MKYHVLCVDFSNVRDGGVGGGVRVEGGRGEGGAWLRERRAWELGSGCDGRDKGAGKGGKHVRETLLKGNY